MVSNSIELDTSGLHRYNGFMVEKRTLKQWATVYRGFGNPNRLRILRMLSEVEKMAVSELADELEISLKNTSRNLGILLNLDLIEFRGRHDRVYYSLNKGMASEIKTILRLTFR